MRLPRFYDCSHLRPRFIHMQRYLLLEPEFPLPFRPGIRRKMFMTTQASDDTTQLGKSFRVSDLSIIR